MRAVAELLVLLPILVVQRDPTSPPGFWSPFEFKMTPYGEALYPTYATFLRYFKYIEHRMNYVVVLTFLVAWAVDVLVYFG